ncbi:hypothetical protein Aab01nite_63440 [Paractinoplanes abujensis]|nr:hypothetical protein Aab01nite_63440 [Actinoplanes abujensis]
MLALPVNEKVKRADARRNEETAHGVQLRSGRQLLTLIDDRTRSPAITKGAGVRMTDPTCSFAQTGGPRTLIIEQTRMFAKNVRFARAGIVRVFAIARNVRARAGIVRVLAIVRNVRAWAGIVRVFVTARNVRFRSGGGRPSVQCAASLAWASAEAARSPATSGSCGLCRSGAGRAFNVRLRSRGRQPKVHDRRQRPALAEGAAPGGRKARSGQGVCQAATQVTPVGAVLVPVLEAVKPQVALAPAARVPL